MLEGTKKNKIAILVYDVSLVGGAERVAINQAVEFSRYYDVYLITLFYENKKWTKGSDNYSLINIATKKDSISKNFLRYSKKIRTIIVSKEIDIVVGITAGVITLANFSAIGTKAKIIYAEHSNLENKTYGKKHILRQYFGARFSDLIVTLTKRDRDNFIEKFKVSTKRVVAIPNWYIEKENYKLACKSDEIRIISVGRIEYVKGYDYLINVAKKLKQYSKKWRWDIYGNGSLYEEIRKKIIKEGLEGCVYLMGNVSEISYFEYSFLVMTSRYEGLPMALLEAQSNKLPIVAFDCPTGPSEIVVNNKNGFLVPCFDEDSMTEKIMELIENDDLRIEFSNNSGLTLKNFDKDKVIGTWIDEFDKLMK